jgi:hypothetical protein
MPTFDQQAQIAYKNLLGKSQTNETLGVLNEVIGYSMVVPSKNVWSSKIPTTPSEAVSNNVGVKIRAKLIRIVKSLNNSQYRAFQAQWDTVPSGKDPKTNQDYSFGVGSLLDVKQNDDVLDFISSANGTLYEVAPFIGSNEIGQGDGRDWMFQYSSGILYMTNPQSSEPNFIEGYFYIGNKLSAFDPVGPDVVRVSATGPDMDSIYYATNSNPFISTYSTNNLFLIDFAYGNTSSVRLNIDYIGTYSVYKFGPTGLTDLVSGDIMGATGATSGPVYYVNWDTNGYFLFNTANPTQLPGKYVNPNDTANDVGGIKRGSQFDNVLFQDVFTDLLYPDQLSNFNSYTLQATTQSDVELFDLGRILITPMTFSWAYNNIAGLTGPTRIIDSTSDTNTSTNWPTSYELYLNTGAIVQGNLLALGTLPYTIFSNTPRYREYKISVKRINGTTIATHKKINWTYRAYFGSSNNTTLLPAEVTSLKSKLVMSSVGTYSLDGTSGYKYIALPDVTGYNFNSINYKNTPLVLATAGSGYTLSDNDNNYYTMTVTNSYNVGNTYRIYRSMNKISGTISVNII